MTDSGQTTLSTDSLSVVPAREFSNVVSLAIAARIIHGAAVAQLISSTVEYQLNAVSMGWLFPLVMASLICGIAIGTATDHILASTTTAKLPTVVCAVSTAVGMLALILFSGPTTLLLAAFVMGLAVQTDWSTLADVTRRSLHATNRWNKMRWFHVAFAGGLFVGAFLIQAQSAPLIMVTAIIVVGAGLMIADFPGHQQPVEVVHPEAVVPNERPSSAAVPSAVPSTAAVSQESGKSEECDAVECCGGASKQFQATPFGQCVVISSVGFCLLWGYLPGLMSLQLSVANLAVISASMCVGQLLLLSAAPSVGYAVAVLPFLLLNIPVVVLTTLIPPDSFFFLIVTCLGGFFAGPAVCGISAIVGEHSSDCPTDAKRTRIISTSLFATAVVTLISGLVSLASFPAMLWGIVSVIGIIAISSIPSPMVSNMGTDESDEQTDAELKDIVAAINN